jgi:hypothetical protein
VPVHSVTVALNALWADSNVHASEQSTLVVAISVDLYQSKDYGRYTNITLRGH